jgi:hypothetical protein
MREEQWYVVDTRVYTCLDIRENKNHTSCVLIGYGYKEDPNRLLLYLIGTLSRLT